MLIELRSDVDSGAEAAFRSWWERTHQEMATWDVGAFFVLLNKLGVAPRAGELDFFRDWTQRCAKATGGASALTDPEMRRLIIAREHTIRRYKRRLKAGHYLKTWRQPTYSPDEIYQLSYRHRVGRQIAHDIALGLTQGKL
jgi:hypothetical protein